MMAEGWDLIVFALSVHWGWYLKHHVVYRTYFCRGKHHYHAVFFLFSCVMLLEMCRKVRLSVFRKVAEWVNLLF